MVVTGTPGAEAGWPHSTERLHLLGLLVIERRELTSGVAIHPQQLIQLRVNCLGVAML
jgi:hypothetical protein